MGFRGLWCPAISLRSKSLGDRSNNRNITDYEMTVNGMRGYEPSLLTSTLLLSDVHVVAQCRVGDQLL